MSARLDYAVGGEAAYTGADAWGVLPGDIYDNAQMQAFTPPIAQQQGLAWWEGLAMYGITRAIDNRFGAPNVVGNVQPGTFGAQSGATVGQRPQSSGGGIGRPGQVAGDNGGGGMGMGSLLLIGAAALAFMAMAG